MLRLGTQLRLRLLVLVAVSFGVAMWTLWKGETMRAQKDVRTLLEINYRDVKRGFTDRADYQLTTIARDLAERFKTSGKLAEEDVAALCAKEEIAEIYDINTNGIVVGGSRLVGEKVHGEQWSEFLCLLKPDGPESMGISSTSAFRRTTSGPRRRSPCGPGRPSSGRPFSTGTASSRATPT